MVLWSGNENTVVAIIGLMNDADPGTIDAFEKEIQFTSQLDHKNVQHLYWVFTIQRHFLMSFTVKIAKFGMSRNLHKSKYYQG